MKTICKKLKGDIEKNAKGKFNPCKKPFQPKDLGLVSSDYGSFSDHCKNTLSSKWCGCGLLKQTEKQKPFKYILIK